MWLTAHTNTHKHTHTWPPLLATQKAGGICQSAPAQICGKSSSGSPQLLARLLRTITQMCEQRAKNLTQMCEQRAKNLGRSSASSIYGFDFNFQPVTPEAAATLVKSSDLGLTKKIL